MAFAALRAWPTSANAPGGQACSPPGSGISQEPVEGAAKTLLCHAELGSVLRRWAIIKLAPFEHRANGFSNEPEEMSQRMP